MSPLIDGETLRQWPVHLCDKHHARLGRKPEENNDKGRPCHPGHGGTETGRRRPGKPVRPVCSDRRVVLLAGCQLRSGRGALRRGVEAEAGELAGFPNLRVIFNLGAGVDALMADRSLPACRWCELQSPISPTGWPIRRAACADASPAGAIPAAVAERKTLATKVQWAANAVSVGIMGLGTSGANAADTCAGSAFASPAGAAAKK